MLDGALARAAEGWRVFPVYPGQKTPAVDKWHIKATRDPDQIVAWWTENPTCNVGTCIGTETIVVDVDVRDTKVGDQSLARILAEYGPMPPTRVHRTSSGGWHYIFRRPGDWDVSQGPLHPDYPGIDIKTGNAVIILPPSHTAQGERSDEGDYTVESDVTIAVAPDWVEALRNHRAVQAERTNAHAPGVVGSRNEYLTRLAGQFRRRGQDEIAIRTQLLEINSTWAQPLNVREITTIAHSAMRWKPEPLGGLDVVFRDKAKMWVTDQTTSRWLMQNAGPDIRFVGDQGEWLAWDGKRWSRNPNATGARMWMSQAAIREEFLEMRRQENRVYETAASDAILRTLETAAGQAGCWKVSQLDASVTIDSADLDADAHLLNCENGIVDLRTGVLSDHNRSALMTHLAPTEYDPSADMQDWETFVLWCCSGDHDQAHWLKVALGQSLIGVQEEHVCLFMFGTGGNGKTQLTDAIRRTLGSYAIESTADLITVKGRDQLHTETLASLFGKRFVICPEPDKGTHWNAGRLKALTGGEEIRARHLYGREFSFNAKFTLVVHGNHQPEIRDHSEGFNRRMRLVPFSNKVLMENRVPELGAKLAGPGVLRWLVEGALEYQRSLNRLPASQMIARATGDYFNDQNHMLRWLDEWCVPDPDGWAPVGELYPTYQYWCKAEGLLYVETKQLLSAFLRERGYKPWMREIQGRKVRGYAGLRLAHLNTDDLPA
jgi:putative DNA primase/helicase